ncbi:MAG TPA: MFS transporter, partial [Patescibacteria group bacterium]|nr:MFS transporter [Patescibacteria group bacterium]
MRKEEQYICNECPEISIGEYPDWASKILVAFPAFKSKNYQYYFTGQLVSLIGTWLQVIAEGWLVLQLTNSPFLIGLVAALATAPSLLLSLFGGVLVDRFQTKTILLVTQSAAMVLALIYGLLTIFHVINLLEICILAFLLGIVNAIDIPARQAFVVELVDKEELGSAIALNSGTFNGARVIGPAVAGLLIGFIGSGGAFILNGISYIASIIGLVLFHVHAKKESTAGGIHPIAAIKRGLQY